MKASYVDNYILISLSNILANSLSAHTNTACTQYIVVIICNSTIYVRLFVCKQVCICNQVFIQVCKDIQVIIKVWYIQYANRYSYRYMSENRHLYRSVNGMRDGRLRSACCNATAHVWKGTKNMRKRLILRSYSHNLSVDK